MSRLTFLNLSTYVVLWCCVIDVFTLEEKSVDDSYHHSTAANGTDYRYYEKRFKLLQNLLKLSFQKKLFAPQNATPAKVLPLDDALRGVYSECVFALSFSCLQKKLVAFLYKLDKVKHINLIGESVMIVRKRNVRSDATILAKMTDNVDQEYLKEIIDELIERFFDNHFVRVRVPGYLEDPAADGDEGGTYLDIDFGSKESSSIREGRKKKKKSKHYLKKLMMLLGLMTCVKLIMMGPLMLGLLGLKAMKALIFAVISITISKMMMLSKVNLSHLMSSSHGAWSSVGHGGWDRNIQEMPPTPPTSALPFYIEPPEMPI